MKKRKRNWFEAEGASSLQVSMQNVDESDGEADKTPGNTRIEKKELKIGKRTPCIITILASLPQNSPAPLLPPPPTGLSFRAE
ncbi:hypothetical protein C0Q70_16475 [Pomacea canaliculata]|uniref:Uncharacterized protein n=1 Tax=Pomacea canaliculata TaxID=400727 RepID=A0A2T7NPY2_POMCA|nr:hypothetical protein C0Q70_16475 [Pomacea canaliculata]